MVTGDDNISLLWKRHIKIGVYELVGYAGKV
jgi:hypothetical protein